MSLFERLFSGIEEDEGFLRAHAVHDFTFEVERRMEGEGITKADLARRLGTSRAYVTKMLRGDANFTVASMVRVARALGARLHLRVEPGPCGERRENNVWGQRVSIGNMPAGVTLNLGSVGQGITIPMQPLSVPPVQVPFQTPAQAGIATEVSDAA